MADQETINEHDFLNQVSNEFYRLKALREMEKLPAEPLRFTFGCLSLPIISILQFMTNKALKAEKAKRDYESLTDEGNAILNSKETKLTVRKAFEELLKNEIVTEETFVEVFAKALMAEAKQSKGEIRLDPVLFAPVGYTIFTMGIREFCHQIDNEG